MAKNSNATSQRKRRTTARSSKKTPVREKCACCGKYLSKSQLIRHRKGQAPPHLKASQALGRLALRKQVETRIQSAQSRAGSPLQASETEEDGSETTEEAVAGDPGLPERLFDGEAESVDVASTGVYFQDHAMDGEGLEDYGYGVDSQVKEELVCRVEKLAAASVRRRYPATVEDCESESDSESDSNHSDSEDGGDLTSEDEWDDEDDIYNPELSARARLETAFMKEVTALEDRLSEADRRLLRIFVYQIKHKLTEDALADIPSTFGLEDLPSFQRIRARVAFLSGVKPERYDCCINSCLAYTGPHADLATCPYCKEPRYDAYKAPRRIFTYIPFTPRLVAMHTNEERAKEMDYRSKFEPDEDVIQDVFDSHHYCNLRSQEVTIDGQAVGHKFFSDPRDIALGLSTDGFAPWRRRKKSAWPIILYNYNLPPQVRFHRENIIPVGVIPGPRKPKDFDSFLWPAVQEFIRLAIGVPAFDIRTAAHFLLHAYLILISGDIPAVSMVMQIKGHNGRLPCRMCKIEGLRIPGARATTHYVPLHRAHHPSVTGVQEAIKQYDPGKLPKRTHKEMLDDGRKVMDARSGADAERLAKSSGVKGLPLLSYLPSVSFPNSFPYDFMHLIWENLIPNLVKLWTGKFKGLGQGSGSYTFSSTVWQAIGEATARTGSTLPGIFGPRLGNISQDQSSCTADAWSVWTQYIAPVLLEATFTHRRYYDHFVDLVELLQLCLQFDMPREDVATIRKGFITWVKTYEKFYYQYDPARLAICPLTVHALLHIADSIEASGPVWGSWAYPMERFCGALQPAIKSRRHPWASIDRHLLNITYISHIKNRYNLPSNELSLRRTTIPEEQLRRGEYQAPNYPTCILMPRSSLQTPNKGLRDRIIGALVTRLDRPPDVIRRHLPSKLEHWAKLRILNSGDTIHSAEMVRETEDRRDQTFVRYEVFVDIFADDPDKDPEYELQTFYGRLDHIITVRFEAASAVKALQLGKATTFIFAAIRACVPEDGPNDQLDIHYYKEYGTLDVVNVTCIQCCVGRVPVLKAGSQRWAVVDRSGSLARALAIDDE